MVLQSGEIWGAKSAIFKLGGPKLQVWKTLRAKSAF